MAGDITLRTQLLSFSSNKRLLRRDTDTDPLEPEAPTSRVDPRFLLAWKYFPRHYQV